MKRRRIIAVGCVLIASAIAWAAVGDSLVPDPPVVQIVMTPTQASRTGVVNLVNNGTTSVTIVTIDQDASCATDDGADITAVGSGGTNMFTVAMGTSHPVVVTCPATGPSATGFGIRRCQFHPNQANTPTGRIASFTGLCVHQGAAQLFSTTTSLNFGSVDINASRALTLAGSASSALSSLYFSVSDQDGNFVVSTPCADVPHCAQSFSNPPMGFSVTVKCTPKRVGPLSAVLHVVGNAGQRFTAPISLTCNGTDPGNVPNITLSKSTVTLDHGVNAGSAMDSVTVSNLGSASLAISSIARSGSDDWSMSVSPPCNVLPCTLAATQSVQIQTVFDPSEISTTLDGNIQITSNDPDAGTVNITLDGTGLGATLALATNLGVPPALDLGSVPIGTPTTQLIDLKNDPGTQPLTASVTTSSPVFTVDRDTFSIGPNAVEPLEIKCVPDAPARRITGTVTIASLDATTGSPITIAVECTGTTGNLFAVPSSLPLGEVRVGTTVVETIALQTNGPALTITSDPQLAPTIAGMAVDMPTSSTVTAAAPSMFKLTVEPTGDGNLATSIKVAAGPDIINIPVTGTAVTPNIKVPESQHLGTFCVNAPTRTSVVALTATGTATIQLGAKPVLEQQASPFRLVYTQPGESGYPYALPASQSAMLELRPEQRSTAGIFEDHILWATDMPGNPSPRTKLTAEFVDDGGAIAPRTTDFGPVPVRQSASSRSLTLQNCGGEDLAISPPVINPTGEFRDLSAEPLPPFLAPDQRVTITVGFTPAKLGVRTATLTVASSRGDLVVDLTGVGTGDPGDVPGRTSFYACDCQSSDPGGLLALGVIFLYVLVPRRRRR